MQSVIFILCYYCASLYDRPTSLNVCNKSCAWQSLITVVWRDKVFFNRVVPLLAPSIVQSMDQFPCCCCSEPTQRHHSAVFHSGDGIRRFLLEAKNGQNPFIVHFNDGQAVWLKHQSVTTKQTFYK